MVGDPLKKVRRTHASTVHSTGVAGLGAVGAAPNNGLRTASTKLDTTVTGFEIGAVAEGDATMAAAAIPVSRAANAFVDGSGAVALGTSAFSATSPMGLESAATTEVALTVAVWLVPTPLVADGFVRVPDDAATPFPLGLDCPAAESSPDCEPAPGVLAVEVDTDVSLAGVDASLAPLAAALPVPPSTDVSAGPEAELPSSPVGDATVVSLVVAVEETSPPRVAEPVGLLASLSSLVAELLALPDSLAADGPCCDVFAVVERRDDGPCCEDLVEVERCDDGVEESLDADVLFASLPEEADPVSVSAWATPIPLATAVTSQTPAARLPHRPARAIAGLNDPVSARLASRAWRRRAARRCAREPLA